MTNSFKKVFGAFAEKFPLPMVLDGSTGTSLMREGMPAGACTEKWVLEHPEAIKKIQAGYLQAGSDAVYCPTFGANRPTLERNGISEVCKTNCDLAALSVGKGCFVGGDMSPTGLFIEPFGDTPFEEVVSIYREQAEALHKSGVDFFAVETNISLQEARAAVIGIREVSDKPIFVTVTVDDRGYTLSGDSLDACLLSLAELGISAFGTNCSQGPDKMLPLLARLVSMSISLGIPLIAKPNAGLPHECADGTRKFDLDADTFGKFVPEFLNAGIPILGGCCGTDAEYIRRIREAVDSFTGTELPEADRRINMLACTNRTVVRLSPEDLSDPIDVDDDFFDRASEEMDAGKEFLFIRLTKSEDIGILSENLPMIPLPIAVTGDTAAIDQFKRSFNGKILVVSQ